MAPKRAGTKKDADISDSGTDLAENSEVENDLLDLTEMMVGEFDKATMPPPPTPPAGAGPERPLVRLLT